EKCAHPAVGDDRGTAGEPFEEAVGGLRCGHLVSFSVARHILPGSSPGRVWHLALAEQVAEASQGRFPQPLSMRSGTCPLPVASVPKTRSDALSGGEASQSTEFG